MSSGSDAPLAAPALAECTALLSGSSGGIALQVAVALARAGVPRIVLNGRRTAAGEQAIREVRSAAPAADVRYVTADVTRPDAAATLCGFAGEAFGSVEIVVTSVGGADVPRPFAQARLEQFQPLFAAHLLSTLHVCHTALPLMTRGGTIVNIASDAAKVPTPGEAVIGALKAGVAMFSRTLALEVARRSIRVHALTPSIVRGTATYNRLMADPFSQRLFAKAERRAALGVATPEDIAAAVVFLASPAAAKITGQVVSINGGISAG